MHLDPSNGVAPLAPYQYEMVYVLLREPLTAPELASNPICRFGHGNPQAVASSLSFLVKRGWIERSPDEIYRATEKARRAVSW